jgi:hypothetical protein
MNWKRSVSVIGRFDWAASIPPQIETTRNAAVGRNRRRMRTPSMRREQYSLALEDEMNE